ncbi:MAG: AbrB/MazE/SpoVT family DNA-binding domain-containing protein [Solirubrobacterales bacterium]
MPQIKLGRQGRIVIPAEIREELGLDEGTQLIARVDGKRLLLETPDAVLARIRQEFRANIGDRDLVAELIANRREEARREDEEIERYRNRP